MPALVTIQVFHPQERVEAVQRAFTVEELTMLSRFCEGMKQAKPSGVYLPANASVPTPGDVFGMVWRRILAVEGITVADVKGDEDKVIRCEAIFGRLTTINPQAKFVGLFW